MVAPLGLLDPVEVLRQRLLGLPGGAVDPLQLLVLLVAAPVRRRGAHQRERRDPLGGRQVRAAAQVLPRQRAVATQVVVDGQLRPAHLDRGALGRVVAVAGALEPDQLELVGLVGQLVDRLRVAHRAPREPLPLLDDLAHPGLERVQVLRHERGLDVEVVVEPVLDRRADAELGVGEQLLHRLRQHVRGGVPQDVAAVLAVDRHALDLGAAAQLVGQVAQLAVDPRRHHRGGVGEELPRLGAGRHRPLLTRVGVPEDDSDLGHGNAPSRTRRTDRPRVSAAVRRPRAGFAPAAPARRPVSNLSPGGR